MTAFLASPNPRVRSCVRCGRLPDRCVCEAPAVPSNRAVPQSTERVRIVELERWLTANAAKAAGLPDSRGLDDFADARAWSGGVRAELDAAQEIAEEVADGRNYCVWGIEQVWDEIVVGDSDAVREYDRLMRALSHLVAAWSALVVR